MQPGRIRLPLQQAGRTKQNRSNFPASVALVCLPVLFLIRYSLLLAGPLYSSDGTVDRVNAIVSELRAQLRMEQEIRVSIVEANPRMVSVEHNGAPRSDGGVFVIRFDQNFLLGLNDADLRAAIAHELGHIWIFSHHPYLQTETLANEIALKVVTRESLKKIYDKLWVHLGVRGNLDEFIAPEAAHSASR